MKTSKVREIRYDDMYDVEEEHWWYRGLRDVLTDWLQRLKPKRLLDAGCGTGFNMLHFHRLGYHVTGIDESEKALLLAKKRGLKNLRLSQIQDLPYKTGEFDAIICLDVLGCLSNKDRAKALSEFFRCLKPSGNLILHVAALEWLFSSHDILWDIKKRFTKKELKNLLTREGFEVKKITYRVAFLFPLVLIFKLLDKVFSKIRGTNPYGDTKKTNIFLNNLFFPIMKFEAFTLKYIDFPIGSSLFVVAGKN